MKGPLKHALAALCAALIAIAPLRAQDAEPADAAPIAVDESRPSDAALAEDINEIFAEIHALADVEATVAAGVARLTGTTTTAEAADRAEALAARVEGVVTVENAIERDVSVDARVAPALADARGAVEDAVRSAPLFLFALAAFLAIAALGWLLSRWTGLWRRLTPNAFVAEIAATSARVVFFALALVAALSLLDATALLGAVLGAAGVLGLAVGFAVRDTIENYIASIMLSLRQPFRPNDHVVIDDKEGRVVRLTSRATILMTMDGNHLRIPNASVFKAVILNYTRNPERRFEFELGVDAEDDPLAAVELGLGTMRNLPFVLSEPASLGYVKAVGDSNILIVFAAWIDQNQSDFLKSRSVALAATKDALEAAGFALPEPIYRLRFDASAPAALRSEGGATVRKSSPAPSPAPRSAAAQDTSPDTNIAEKVDEERREGREPDFLDRDAPVE